MSCDTRNMLNVFKYLLLLLSTFVPQLVSHPILIVVSFDGFRNDYVNQSVTPTLYKLAQNGVRGQHSLKSMFLYDLFQWLPLSYSSYEIVFCDEDIPQSPDNSHRLL